MKHVLIQLLLIAQLCLPASTLLAGQHGYIDAWITCHVPAIGLYHESMKLQDEQCPAPGVYPHPLDQIDFLRSELRFAGSEPRGVPGITTDDPSGMQQFAWISQRHFLDLPLDTCDNSWLELFAAEPLLHNIVEAAQGLAEWGGVADLWIAMDAEWSATDRHVHQSGYTVSLQFTWQDADGQEACLSLLLYRRIDSSADPSS